MTKDGPIIKLIENGYLTNPGNLATARGAAYELEVAYDLAQAGETVIKIGGDRIPLIDKVTGKIINTFEVDIVTTNKIIECKNWNWECLSHIDLNDRINKLKSNLMQLNLLATSQGKTFEFHSKFPMPDQLKSFLRKNLITFIER